MGENLAIWAALSKTDPAHTKPFNRAGGFKGTAIKPIWIIKKLTEQFGPAGVGWGVGEPSFQVVQGDGEILVYCTVSAWHTDQANVLWGVGGDKVLVKRSSGSFHDDEAFKKAFTDAINNAFKSLGVGADVHMGLFDDDKYVTAAKAEFAAESAPEPPPYDLELKLEEVAACETLMALKRWWKDNSDSVPAPLYDRVLDAVNKRTEAVKLMDRSAA